MLRHLEDLGQRGIRVDGFEDASGGCHAEPAHVDECADETQSIQVNSPVAGLVNRLALARRQQFFAEVELDGGHRDAAGGAQLGHSHTDSITIR